MKYVALAVLLIVMQAPPPVPRQAADKPARASNSVKQDSSNKQHPPDARMRPPTTAESNQPEGQEQRSRDTQETVIIREPAAVPKDGWTHASVIATWLLVIIGGLGVCAALRTLRAIERQADIMESYTEPSLQVDSVRMVAFGEGQQAYFFVKVINSGLIAAENVSVRIGVTIADGASNSPDQVIMVPAKDARECFIRYGSRLDSGLMERLDRGNSPLQISGHVTWKDKTVKYCYKYNPWRFDEPRPDGFPRFVPCDFDTRVTMSEKI
jgi:hypothetical protein